MGWAGTACGSSSSHSALGSFQRLLAELDDVAFGVHELRNRSHWRLAWCGTNGGTDAGNALAAAAFDGADLGLDVLDVEGNQDLVTVPPSSVVHDGRTIVKLAHQFK